MSARLSVNVNKIALLRNARGADNPNLLQVVEDCIRFGAEGITVHPRPDGRHIRRDDLFTIKEAIEVEFNVEGYPSPDFLKLMAEIKPAQCTLVPDPPEALTSNAGWDVKRQMGFLKDVIAELKAAGARVSIFLDTELQNIEMAPATGTDRIELYTGPYAHHFLTNPTAAIEPYTEAAVLAAQLGLGLNAGHDLNLHNLAMFARQVPGLLEVSIGHALVTDALYLGLRETIQRYLSQLVIPG